GSVETLGYGSNAIFAQSAGPQGSGVVTVNIDGSIMGGDGPEGSAIWITGNNQNYLNTSPDSIIQALSNIAINYQSSPVQQSKALAASDVASASLSVNNAGRVYGNIQCGNGLGQVACDVNNKESGILSDATLYQANIHNDGLVVIGKPGAFDTLSVTGDFDLNSAGILQADVDFDQLKSPRMVVLGDTRLDGQVNTQPYTLLPNREVTVATLEGHIRGAPRAKDSPVIDYDARLDGKHVRVRAAGADFAAESMGLGPNQRAVAGHLQSAWDMGGTSAM